VVPVVDKLLRAPKELIMKPLANSPLRHLHPTTVTVASALVGVVAALAAWQNLYVVAIVLWIFNRILDGLDGTLARQTGQQSDLGAYLDTVLDHIVYAAIPFGLALAANSLGALIALAILLTSFYVNAASWMYLAAIFEKRAAGAKANGELTGVTMPSGLIEGAETIVFYSLFLLFPTALIPLFALMALLVAITAGQRVVWALQNL
jgi:phosphatidylglycerophosphate synthase